MKNYFAYIRVSTARQGERGVSLTEQRDAIERYAQTNALTIVEWFEERITAAKSGRPIFSKMLAELKRGRAQGVLIHKIDRSARNLRDWANLGELLDNGIDVRFAHEGLDLNSRGGRLSADIQAVVAADYIRNLREETRKGFYGRLKQGLYPMAAPRGYRDNGAGQPKTICPVEGPIVKKGFVAYASGQYSVETLAEALFEWGLKTRHGEKLAPSGVAIMLKNPFYIGCIRIKRTGEVFEGKHEPLITTALFQRVQDVFEGRKPKRKRVHNFLFRQLFICKACGRQLIGERQKGHVYYRCHAYRCRQTCIGESLIDAAVGARLRPIRLSNEELKMAMLEANLITKELTADSQILLQSLELQEAAISTRLDRLLDAFIDQHVAKPDYEQRKEALIIERTGLREKIQALRSNSDLQARNITETLELAKTLNIIYETAPRDEKRDLLEMVFSNRRVLGKYVELSMYKPFFELENRPLLLSGAPHRRTSRTWWRKFLKRHTLRSLGYKDDTENKPKRRQEKKRDQN